jgi:hypothetical protein
MELTEHHRAVVTRRDGPPIGRLAYLETTESKLFAVAEIDGSRLGEGP